MLLMEPGPGGMTKGESVRMDRKGVPIGHRKDGTLTKARKVKMPHKVTFADTLKIDESKEKFQLEQIIIIESYKKHNQMNNYASQGCCTVF
jgi:hypothetical protein